MNVRVFSLGRRVLGRTRGLTLIEVIVSLSIIAIIAALLISAVISARDSARRADCANHLHQIGIALASYSSSIGIYPQGNNGRGYSVHSMVLPYMEQANLYNLINFSVDPSLSMVPGGSNETVSTIRVSTFLCPSEPQDLSNTGKTSYAGNRGSGVQKYGYNGAFGYERDGPLGYSAFVDGTSTTAALSEWLLGTYNQMKVDALRSTFDTPEPLTRPEDFDRFVNQCLEIDLASAKLNFLAKGSTWLRGDFSFTLYNHTMRINSHTCTNGTAVQVGAWTAGSTHPGGCHTLFIDGHVKFMSATISLPVWRGIGSRAGGENLGDEF